MTINLLFTNQSIRILFSGLRSLMCLQRTIDVPFTNIVSVKKYNAQISPQGFRCPGTNLPRLVAAGTYYKGLFPRKRDFWNVVAPANAIEVTLRDHYYQRMIFDIDEPEKWVGKIQSHLAGIKDLDIVEQQVLLPGKDVNLAGTLVLPQMLGKCPAVIFVAGSGPTDRDWNSIALPGKNGSGKLLAEALSHRGYVTFRYDKRGIGESGFTHSAPGLRWDDYMSDLKQAVDFVRDHEAVDKNAIFVLGHSEGGMHALRLALSDYASSLKGLLLAATPAKSLGKTTLSQLTVQLPAILPAEEVQPQIEKLAAAFNCIAQKKPLPAVEEVSAIPAVQQLYRMFIVPSTLKFLEDFLDFDPLAALSKTSLPTVVISGEKDLQVDPQRDAIALVEGAIAQGRRDVDLLLMPNADHVLKHQEIPRAELTPQMALSYNSPERQLDPEVVHALSKWLDTQCAPTNTLNRNARTEQKSTRSLL